MALGAVLRKYRLTACCQSLVNRERVFWRFDSQQVRGNVRERRLLLLDIGRAVKRRKQIDHIHAGGASIDAAGPIASLLPLEKPPGGRIAANILAVTEGHRLLKVEFRITHRHQKRGRRNRIDGAANITELVGQFQLDAVGSSQFLKERFKIERGVAKTYDRLAGHSAGVTKEAIIHKSAAQNAGRFDEPHR